MADIKPLKILTGTLAQASTGDVIPNEYIDGDFQTGSNKLRIPTAASDPASPDDGQIYLNTTDLVIKVAINGEWLTVGVVQ